ncbi:HAD family hydrolase [Sphingomonas sp. SUN019]|uniref:HAD family hydrolase n=1 Tax=Sphingomonas sp. SUN019 TaxID=2937788 RepID=UPI0021640EE4|nr:HAD family hydrolase [Sphingomonas sp. SUN019]UVO50357.1 HAD family hydrolase [Sphingomonas sp. SUN019]
MPSFNASLDWDEIDLVVFDMDGTLYDQKKLRARMLMELLRASARDRSLDTVLTLRAFRHTREMLADTQAGDFLSTQYEIPAARRGCEAARVRALVAEWMEQRPLPYLAACRRPGIEQLFGAIARTGRRIGILSDYPAADKLAALGLRADFIVAATDPDVARLKPDTTGLDKLMRLAEVDPRRAVLIGDRVDRDGAVAARAGMRALILSRRPHAGVDCFGSFGDALFRPLLGAPPRGVGPLGVTKTA